MENLDEFIKNHSRYQIGDVLWIREPVKIVNCKIGLNNTEAFVKYENGEGRIIKNIDKYFSSKRLDYPKLSNCFEPAIHEQKEKFIKLWNSTVTKGYKWEDNPYVWVYEWDYI